MNTKVKENRPKSKYNPALDKFENSDLFKAQTELIDKKFEGRNLLKEIEDIKDKEGITSHNKRFKDNRHSSFDYSSFDCSLLGCSSFGCSPLEINNKNIVSSVYHIEELLNF